MPASKTHNSIVLRPPPGTRFTIFGSDVHLEFQREKIKEVHDWLADWVADFIYPEIVKEANRQESIRAMHEQAVAEVQTQRTALQEEEMRSHAFEMAKSGTVIVRPSTDAQIAALESKLEELKERKKSETQA